ncbi:hypothetical protein Tco_0955458 [Tanacetum coccineum]|uniref:Retrotransposon gag domain-containing protein n=1 Tax=Tanacetum coccineum TaxID=301880 RepID=A0ABQ5E795_9ASTR
MLVAEQIENTRLNTLTNFLKYDSLNVPNVSHDRLRVSIFPVSLTGAASEWFKDESISFITKWVDLADKFFGKFYPPSHAGRKVETNKVNKMILCDPIDTKFENWLASKFMSYKTMDRCTKNALWNYWKKGNDQKVMTNGELYNSEDGNLNEEEEIAQVFRIDTNIFHFKTPLCKAFEEFNYLFGIDADVLTKDIPGFKTYEEYKDDRIYEWNDKIPWVHEKTWMADGVWKELTAVKHGCKPFCFKSGHSEWPTYYEHDANIEAEVNSNYNPYFDISRLFNDHTIKNDDKDVQDEMELNKDKDDDMGYLDDYLVHGNAPFIIN